MADKILMYKDRPLVRQGNVIYYGYMDKPAVLVIQIKSTKELNGVTVADDVVVNLLKTDPTIIKLREKVVKSAEKKGLYAALEVGNIWLERELKKC